ncbi:MAG: 2-oxo acid dehydrogenase subunit E2 [Elusimicrobia bacterium]|nr:2-oxo acid dehydrogenase subunit E2 [Elusimicrobiota bacterium]
MNYEFKLPDIGEGLTEGEIVKWHVKEGDSVKENQPLCNVLTDKAEVEIPSPKTGKISKLMARAGEKIKVHAPLVVFELASGGAGAPQPQATRQAAATHTAQTTQPSTPRGAAGVAEGISVSATPAVRRLAAELKVDLARVKGSGPAGRITEDDVRKAAGAPDSAPQPAPAPVGAGGGEDKVPFVGIRRRTAEKMAESHRTVAAVTHMDEADFTALVGLRSELKPQAEAKGLKLTYLPFIIRALVKTLKEFPNFNAVLDEAGGAIVRKRGHNIGIATSAEQGLIVPVIKGAENRDVWGLASEIQRLADKVRSGKIEVSELQGGTFTITNIGPIGGLFATPIVNHPEVAILGVMKIKPRPVVKDGGIHVREMGNLALSFDHRVVDGAEAAQFMNTLVKRLENPRTLL